MHPLLALVVATTLTAHRPDGTPVPDAQICRFAAGDRENPYKRWFASQDVVCGGEWGKGLWNVFARTGDGVSAAPVLVEGNAPVTLTLEKAATVMAALPEKRRGVIYVPRKGSAFPVEARTVVPAEEELWLIVLDRSTPVAIVTIPPLAPQTERSVDARNASEASVLAWVQVSETDRNAIANATGLLTPGIRAVAGVVTREAAPLPPPSLLSGALVRMRDVPEGSAELRIEGRGWVRERQTVKVQPGLTLTTHPLRLRAAGILTVQWSTNHDLVALDRSLGACSSASDSAPLVVVAISSCPQPRANPDACSLVREETFDPTPRMGSVTLDDVVPGAYRAELRFGKLPPVSNGADVLPLRPRDLYLTAAYSKLSGRVTHGGEPLGEEVQIKFTDGYGFAPAETDQYHAVMLPKFGALPSDSQVTVAACDGDPKAVVLTDTPVRMIGSLDLDIPANQLTINVTDTFTREPLTGATVQYEVMSQSKTRVAMQGTLVTGSHGNIVMKAVPPLRELRFSVRLSGYQKQELERFSMTAREEKTIDVELVPLRGTRGQIVSDRPFENGVVVWYSDRGRETERADLAADGTFVYSNWHAPEETMTVVSVSHPLWVLRSPAIGRRESIALKFPIAPVRAFDVRASASWHVGIEIGGLRVPQPLFLLHQSLRQAGRDVTMVSSAKPLHVYDLLATGLIDVLLTSSAMEEIARQRLAPDATSVVFPP